jgi:hypothetical protein
VADVTSATQGTRCYRIDAHVRAPTPQVSAPGVQDEKQTEDEFMADEPCCSEFATAEGALWLSGSMITEKGSVYCVASL